jgi:hypothetical protein
MTENSAQKFYSFAFISAIILLVSTVTIRLIATAKEY